MRRQQLIASKRSALALVMLVVSACSDAVVPSTSSATVVEESLSTAAADTEDDQPIGPLLAVGNFGGESRLVTFDGAVQIENLTTSWVAINELTLDALVDGAVIGVVFLQVGSRPAKHIPPGSTWFVFTLGVTLETPDEIRIRTTKAEIVDPPGDFDVTVNFEARGSGSRIWGRINSNWPADVARADLHIVFLNDAGEMMLARRTQVERLRPNRSTFYEFYASHRIEESWTIVTTVFEVSNDIPILVSS